MERVRATVIADASFCPTTKAGGWAVWVNVNWPGGRHERIKRSGTFHRRPTSSTWAEAMAVWNGIFFAYTAGARDILAQTDCLEIVQNRGAPSSTKGFHTYADARAKHWPEATVRFKHVKGHNLKNVQDRRTWVNDWCDKEAKRHMKKQRGNHHANA